MSKSKAREVVKMLVLIPLGLALGWLTGAFAVTVLMLFALIMSTIWLALAFVYDWSPFWSLIPLLAAWLLAWLLHLLGIGSDLHSLATKAREDSRSQADDDRPAD